MGRESSFTEVDRTGFWKYKNHARRLISRLRFRENLIEIFTGESTKSVNRAYALQRNGALLPEYTKEVQDLAIIKKQKPDKKAESLIMMINSAQREKLVEGLWLLVQFVGTKGSLPYYSKIADSLEKYINTDDSEVFDILWKIIKGIIKRQPQIMDPFISQIIARLKKSGIKNESYLFRLGELGRANPKWIVNEMPLIRRKLYSPKWNERRFAAFAIASIGSSDVSIVKETIPIIVEYPANPDRVRKELGGHLYQEQFVSNISAEISYNISAEIAYSSPIEMDPATMIRDACIDALGEIGKNFPKSVELALPLLQDLSKGAPSHYTVKKAMRAIDAIKGNYKGTFRHLI